MSARYRKKPAVIDAMRFGEDNAREVARWCDGELVDWEPPFIEIKTLEGTMTALPGDYVIKGTQGEFYPCKPDIFEQIYEPAP